MALKHIEHIEKARKEIGVADHLIFVTFKVVNEAKFLLAISEHIITAAQKALEALLEYERHYKRMEPFHYSFAVEVSLFRQKLEGRYSFDPKYYRLLNKLLELQRFDKESVVRFRRGEKYILTSSEYSMNILDLDSIKRFSSLTKKFVNEISNIVTKES